MHVRPMHVPSTPKPREKTYGSYEELNSPPISQSLGGGGGCREKAEPVPAGSSAALIIPELHETDEIPGLDQQR